MIRDIFFDIDNTLLDFNASEAQSLRRALLQAGIEPTDTILSRYHAINQSQWELLEKGELTRMQVRTRRFDLLFAELGIVYDSDMIAGFYENFLAQSCIFISGTQELLDALAPKYTLYVATNGSAEVQHSRLRIGNIEKYFQAVFISEEIGVHKPSPEFFRFCFEHISNFDPETAIMVGDSLTSDICGGRDAGLRTCWFNPLKKPPRPDILPDYQFTALEQLPALLKKI